MIRNLLAPLANRRPEVEQDVDQEEEVNRLEENRSLNADGMDNPTILVDLVDEDGTHAVAGSLSLTVDNVPPTIALSGATNVDEGSPYTLTLGLITDPGEDTVTDYIVHWGDGQSDSYTTSGDVTHTYADGLDNPTILVDLIDEDGTQAAAGSRSTIVCGAARLLRLVELPACRGHDAWRVELEPDRRPPRCDHVLDGRRGARG